MNTFRFRGVCSCIGLLQHRLIQDWRFPAMSKWIIEDDGVLQFDQVVRKRKKVQSILLMAEIRRSPVEGTVV